VGVEQANPAVSARRRVTAGYVHHCSRPHLSTSTLAETMGDVAFLSLILVFFVTAIAYARVAPRL
jgi:hypothetical protein